MCVCVYVSQVLCKMYVKMQYLALNGLRAHKPTAESVNSSTEEQYAFLLGAMGGKIDKKHTNGCVPTTSVWRMCSRGPMYNA